MTKSNSGSRMQHKLSMTSQANSDSHLHERLLRHEDLLERARQDHMRHLEMEEKLAALSKFSYEEADYTPQLERRPWQERPLSNYDYLLAEAREMVERRFFYPIAMRAGILAMMLLLLSLGINAVTVWLSITLGFLASGSLYFTIRKRKTIKQQALLAARAEIQRRLAIEMQVIEQERQEHERQEDERIGRLEGLMNGEPRAVMAQLDDVLSKMTLPFILEVDVELYQNIPVFRFWYPAKTIVPSRISTLEASGRVSYEDKDERSINRQYIEICAAATMQALTTAFGAIPSLDHFYVHGMERRDLDDVCVLDLAADRQRLIAACAASGGIHALHQLDARFDSNADLTLLPLNPTYPEGWDQAQPGEMETRHIKIFR